MVEDVYSNRIVDYSIDSRMKSRIAVAALDKAFARCAIDALAVAGCLFHTDLGSQFRSRKLVHKLKWHDMASSMGRVGAAGDSAAMKSIFSQLQKNVLDLRVWNTRKELRIAIVTSILRTYHRRCRQAALVRLTPLGYESITAPRTSSATKVDKRCDVAIDLGAGGGHLHALVDAPDLITDSKHRATGQPLVLGDDVKHGPKSSDTSILVADLEYAA